MKFIIWLKCLFSHKWLYCSSKPIKGKWYRSCMRCNENQHQKDGKWYKGWY